MPEVREHITKVIMDVVRRYDIDAIHFDDYFYPYPNPGETLPDEATFRDYNPDGIAKLADWRRNNVNVLIRDLHDSIRTAKRWVKFGISPFGVWMNKSKDFPEGSDTRAGQPSYAKPVRRHPPVAAKKAGLTTSCRNCTGARTSASAPTPCW